MQRGNPVWAASAFLLLSTLLGVVGATSKPRFLVVTLGSARGGETTWETLYRNVLEYNDADLAILLGDTQDRSASLYTKAKYEWSSTEYDDWGEALDEMGGDGSWRDIARANAQLIGHHALGGTSADPIGNGVVLPYQKWLLRYHLVEEELLAQYDFVVVTRTDYFYGCPVDLEALVDAGDETSVFIPEGQDWRGVCDRFIMCSSNLILDCLNIMEPVVTNTWRYRTFLGNAEMLFKLRLQEDGGGASSWSDST